jgi:allophanate hydrolase
MQLDLASLSAAYAAGTQPEDVIAHANEAADHAMIGAAWITRATKQTLARRIAEIKAARDAGENLPLFGVPFAIKDNIDAEGYPTTAACPAFAYHPTRNASVVTRLERAGAILIGKTNLDQFATGLVGTRSPYGACHSVFSNAHVSGGSSSGSAVSVAAGAVSFALGTDTAGSGRVPAAFNNIVGLKPTRGVIAMDGVMPACRSLDCLSVFAGSCADASHVLATAIGVNRLDPYAREPAPDAPATFGAAPRIAIPEGAEPDDPEWRALHQAAIARLADLGCTIVSCDYAPFDLAARLLYQGPWVAERLAALRERGFLDWAAMDPSVAAIISGAKSLSAADAFDGLHALARARAETTPILANCDALLLPTAPFHPTLNAVAADPIGVNLGLGRFTNFVNLLDLCAAAVPAGMTVAGLPYGVTLIAKAFADQALTELAGRLHASLPGAMIGNAGATVPKPKLTATPQQGSVDLAVVGAHLTGMTLNHQLTTRGARLMAQTHTASGYALYALANTSPPKPGLVRDATAAGGIEIEIWRLPLAAFGDFVREVPPPLAIGTIETADGHWVKGFVCEPVALTGARDITGFGGWRAYLASLA